MSPPTPEDEELLRALHQTEQIGELEATDLMQFAYQIASGMVRHFLSQSIILYTTQDCNWLYHEHSSIEMVNACFISTHTVQYL